MRNLKKFLALVLAMMMAFSLMVTANAKDITATFSDAESVTEDFQVAVDVLNGMKVFEGYTDGTFKPKNNITRAEVATIVYRLATGDWEGVQAHLYKDYQKFTDVTADHWAAGYINYCANAEWIAGYGNGKFGPNDQVTGYQAAAMILRAVGYGKNNEFVGSGWQVQVANVTRSEGLLVNVNNTNYANTLNQPAVRELVAEILFQAAQINTVNWTMLNGYLANKGPSLGAQNYGLKEQTGIIVGNQDTGESSTRINWALTGMPAHVAYFHQTTNFNENTPAATTTATTTGTATIDAKTGLDMFGHKVTAWYCNSTTANGAKLGKTFALYDEVVKTAVVTASDNVLSLSTWAAKGQAPLGEAAQAAGFSVNLKTSKAVFNQDFGVSGSVAKIAATEDQGKSDYVADGANANVGSGDNTNGVASINVLGEDTNTTYPLYLLISNSSNKQVDMVVALNTNVSRVAQVNNHASYPTVTVPVKDSTKTNWNGQLSDMIHQTALTATSTKTLGDPVVGVAIIGTNTSDVKAVCTVGASTPEASGYTPPATTTVTNATNPNLFYRLSKPTQTVEGTVTNFNYDQASHTGSIVIGGKTIERSYLADAIADYDADYTQAPGNVNRGILGTKAVNLSATAQLYGNYRAYLDSEGKYIWIEPIYDTKFVYATYIDYTTPYGSSSYEYTLIGVDLEGNQVKQVVKTVDGQPIDDALYQQIAPSRDTAGGVAAVSPLSYIGYLIDSAGNLTSITANADANTPGMFETISPVVNQAGKGTSAGTAAPNDGGIIDATHPIVINTTNAKLGTMNLTVAAGTADKAANTYFTNDTKFIVVDGAGTDNQKIEVYTGMTELLKGGSRVSISGATVPASIAHDGATAGNVQMYYTQSALTYASVDGTNPMKVDTIVIPKKAITWTGASGLYYVGNPAQNSEIKSGKWQDTTDRVYHLYTMYLDGEAQQVWLINAPGGNSGTACDNLGNHELVADSFYKLYDTGLKTPMGDTVYLANDGSTATATTATAVQQGTAGTLTAGRPDLTSEEPIIGDGIVKYAFYNPATYANQTAIIGEGGTNGTAGDGLASGMTPDTNCAIFNVSNAKVVNLNAANSPTGTTDGGDAQSDGYVWPGVTDLASLNDAASTAITYGGKLPKVCVQVDPTDNLTVTVIYVCWNQTQST